MEMQQIFSLVTLGFTCIQHVNSLIKSVVVRLEVAQHFLVQNVPPRLPTSAAVNIPPQEEGVFTRYRRPRIRLVTLGERLALKLRSSR